MTELNTGIYPAITALSGQALCGNCVCGTDRKCVCMCVCVLRLYLSSLCGCAHTHVMITALVIGFSVLSLLSENLKVQIFMFELELKDYKLICE